MIIEDVIKLGFLSCPCQFGNSMLGNRNETAIEEFWNHCVTCRDWRDHPALNDDTVPRKSALMVCKSARYESPSSPYLQHLDIPEKSIKGVPRICPTKD